MLTLVLKQNDSWNPALSGRREDSRAPEAGILLFPVNPYPLRQQKLPTPVLPRFFPSFDRKPSDRYSMLNRFDYDQACHSIPSVCRNESLKKWWDNGDRNR